MDRYVRVYAKIDLDAIRHNIEQVRAKVGTDCHILAVIKADAYGHGAVSVGLHLQDIVDGFAIAVLEEGVVLRRNGIDKPILLLGYTDAQQYQEAIANRLTMTIYEYEQAQALSKVAESLGAVAKVHIKVDTGMGRIGFLPTPESVSDIKRIANLPAIEIEGMFTHFAKADMVGRAYTDEQLKRYLAFADAVEQAGVKGFVRHVANSAAIMDYPETYLNQVRSGIVTYGLYPSDEVNRSHLDLIPAMELKTHIIYVKEVSAGTSIGYGGTFVTNRKSRIATIPVGYGDGYPRSLSNRGSVLVRGHKVPIVGRVCMDQFMVDVTDYPDILEHDEVTLVGRDGDSVLSVEEVSTLAGSFNYEFCCDVGRRIPRVYYKNGVYDKTVDYFSDSMY